jgi:IS30 family transposase
MKNGQLFIYVYLAAIVSRFFQSGQRQESACLIRQFFTKSSRFENIADNEVEAVMNKLNHRLRKTLTFKTSHMVFFAEPLQEAA